MASTLVFLVRHAKAADRYDWTGGDRDRPLIDKGRKQAERLAAALGREQGDRRHQGGKPCGPPDVRAEGLSHLVDLL